jgi:hypothetical protein
MYFVLSNILAIACSGAISRLLFPNADPVKFALVWLVSFAALVILVLQSLGFLGLISSPAVTMVLAPLAVVLIFLARRRGLLQVRGLETSSAARPGLWHGFAGESLPLAAVVLFSGIVGAAVLRLAFFGSTFSWDDLTYHGPSVAHWVRDQHFSVTPWNAQAYYPKNAELLSMWFTLPFSSDAYVSLAGLYWILLLAVVVMHLCQSLEVPWSGGLLAATICVAAFKSPGLEGFAGTLSAADLAMYTALLAAVALAMDRHCAGGAPGDRSDALMSGIAAGIAAGTKLVALPGVALLGLWWVVASGKKSFARGIPRFLAYCFGAVMLGSFWYLRNIGLTGNPVFPVQIGPLEGFLVPDSRRLLDALVSHPTDPRMYKGIISAIAVIGIAPVLVAMAGYAMTSVWIARLLKSQHVAMDRRILLLSSLGAAYLVLYPLLPLSGFFRGDVFILNLRYVAALILPVGVILFFWASRLDSSTHALASIFGVLAIAVAWRGSAEEATIALCFGAAALAIFGDRHRLVGLKSALLRLAVSLGALTALLAVMVAWQPVKQRMTDANLYQVSYGQSMARAWQFLDAEAPTGSRITWFGPHAFLYYPLFGRDMRLEPVRSRSDGSRFSTFFEEYREVPMMDIYHDSLGVDPETFVEKLLSNRVQYVMVTQANNPGDLQHWKDPLDALSASDHAKLVYGDGQTWIWRLADRSRNSF